jgi:MFS family permease
MRASANLYACKEDVPMPTVVIEGARVDYDLREGGDRPIIFLHGGFGSSSQLWTRTMAALPHRYTAFALNNFIRSDPPPTGYSVAAFAHRVGEFARALGLGRPVLAGHSMGGVVCQLAAQLSNAVGLLLGSGVAALVTTVLTVEALDSWGWRIPFLLGALFGPIGFWLRSSIDETPPFREVEAASGRTDTRAAERKTWKTAAIAVGFAAGWTVCFYAFLNFMPTFTRIQLKLSPAEALWSNTIGLIAFTLCVPMMGALSDRIGRRPLLLLSNVAFLVLPLPVFLLLVHSHSFLLVVAAQLLFGVALSLYSGPGPAAIAELFPTRGRSLWLSLSFSLAVALFGGFTPFISQWLIAALATPLAPSFYIMAVVALSFVVIWNMQETAHKPLP